MYVNYFFAVLKWTPLLDLFFILILWPYSVAPQLRYKHKHPHSLGAALPSLMESGKSNNFGVL